MLKLLMFMGIESKLNDPYDCYKAGIDLSDTKFLLVANDFANEVATNSRYSCLAGKYWKDERFNPYASKFVESVAKGDSFIVEALMYWKAERIKMLKKYIPSYKLSNAESVADSLRSMRRSNQPTCVLHY